MSQPKAGRPEIRVRGLSPLATDLIRKRTRLQQHNHTLIVGRTLLRFFGSVEDFDQIFDYLIAAEIPGAGAGSKEVRRLRQVRQAVRAAVAGTEPIGPVSAEIKAVPPPTVSRVEVLDLLNALWERHCDEVEAERLTELADASSTAAAVPYRAWLDQVL